MQQFERKTLVAGNLVEFCQQTELLIKDGWSFNFLNNELVPIQTGILYYCTMEKPITETESTMGEFKLVANGKLEETEESKTEDKTDAKTEDNVEAVQDQVRRGRKPKAQ